MLEKLDKDIIIEIIATVVFGFLLFVLGASRVAGSYILYSAEETLGNFLWVEFCALLVAFGLVGIVFGMVRGVFYARSILKDN